MDNIICTILQCIDYFELVDQEMEIVEYELPIESDLHHVMHDVVEEITMGLIIFVFII